MLATLERFRAAGLDGVEAFYVTHTEAQTRLLVEPLRSSTGCSRPARLISTAPSTTTFSRFRAFELLVSEPNLGPIAG